MQGFRLGVVLTVGIALVPATSAMAAGEREAHAQAALTTTLRGCHIDLGLYTRDQVLAAGLPATNSHVRATTMSYCGTLSGVGNSTHATSATTSEYAVEGAGRAVMTQSCANDPGFSSYCSTDGEYVLGLQGASYGVEASFVIRLPLGEEFTAIPPQCTPTAVSGRAVACSLTLSLVTQSSSLAG